MLGSRERFDTLMGIEPLATLSADALQELAERFAVVSFADGEVVFAEGDPGEYLFVIVSGTAELSAAGTLGQIPLATLGAGEMVGELSLLAPGGLRNATLTALSQLVLLRLDRGEFNALLSAHPATAAAFDVYAEQLLTARFIKSIGPFMSLDDQTRRALAKRLTRRAYPAGAVILRQGEIGESCYMVRAGTVEVVFEEQGHELVVARLGPRSLFGEAALLSDAPRTATVRTAEACELLELSRSDLEAVLARHRSTVGFGMVQLLRLQERPRRAPEVLLSERPTPEGETLTILKNPQRLTYYRLSDRGRFIWERLDGHHDMRALTLEFFREYGRIAPGVIGGIIDGLARTGMIESAKLTAAVAATGRKSSVGERILAAAHRALTVEVSVRDLDRRVTRAYSRAGWILFTRRAQVLLAVLSVAGLACFVALAGTAHQVLSRGHRELLLLLIPGTFVSVFLHEFSHALAVKAFGREVNRGGVGWYWFGPMAFVDTSDMWLGTRNQRIIVSLAGPYADMVLAGLASVAAAAVSNPVVSALLWSFALPAYIAVLSNLNPLLEFDGYHVLSDLLDRPNLRAEALGWFGNHFIAVLRRREKVVRHKVDLVFALGSLLYVVVIAVAVVVLYRITIRGLIATILPASVATALAWILALLVSVLALLGVASELRARRRPAARD